MDEANSYRSPEDVGSASGGERDYFPPIHVPMLVFGVLVFGLSFGLCFVVVCLLIGVINPEFIPGNFSEAVGIIVVVAATMLCLFSVPALMISNRDGRLTRDSAFKLLNGYGAVVVTVLFIAIAGTVELWLLIPVAVVLFCWLGGSTAFAVWIGWLRRV